MCALQCNPYNQYNDSDIGKRASNFRSKLAANKQPFVMQDALIINLISFALEFIDWYELSVFG
jgi:hypothetical protein